MVLPTFAALMAGAAVLPRGVAVSVPHQSPTIVRQTPRGAQRLVYISVKNPGAATLTRIALHYRVGRRWERRDLVDVPPGEAWDTLWLREPAPATVRARLVQGGQDVLWTGELSIPPQAPARVLIPRGPCVKAADLKPLMLRGTNYYPRHQPWPGIWRAMDEPAFDAEFAEMARLHVNTVRTFYIFDAEAGLHRKDGTFLPALLSRVDTLLRVADRHGMKVMLCLVGGAGAPMSDLVFWRRYFRTGVEPFAYDGRVLMWDLINEPGGPDGPKANPDLARWIQVMYAELRRLAPEHLHTVGLCWQFDQLWSLGVRPPVGQFHNYSGAVGVQPPGQPPVRNVADDLRQIARTINNRPLIIGEFGYASQPDDTRRDASEATQLRISRDVIQGVEAAVRSGVNLVGVYNWCAFHFAPDWMGRGEQSFGVIRLDGTLKPAGEMLRDAYARWRQQVRAPWEKQP